MNISSWQTWISPIELWLPAICIGIAVFVGIFQFKTNDQVAILKWPWWMRAVFYMVCYFLVIFLGAEGGKEFIYFQF